MILHLSESRLNRFADGELSRRLRIRTAAHLEGCSRCRNTIVAIRRLSREARVLPQPSAPVGLKDRILERLANGERVILPVADPPMPVRTGRRVAAAFAATAAVVMFVTLVRAPELASEASELRYSPQTPEMGQELSIEFRSTSRFAGEETLALRGVFRTEELGSTWHDDVPPVTIATLVLDDEGVYRTTFQLPEDVVYAVLAVEDLNGRQVDSRGRQFWEVLAHENSTPTYAALMQKYHDLILRNWGAALETADTITQLYPDKAGGFFVLSSLQKEFFSPGSFALLVEEKHRPTFARLERELERSREYSDDDVAELYSYAMVLDDTAAARRWRTRLVKEAPEHRAARGIRVLEILSQAALGTPPASVLDQLDSLWEEGGLERSLPLEAFRIALQTDDIDAMGRWLDRLERVRPSKVDDWVTEWIVATAGGEASVQRMQALLGQLEEPAQANRALYRTADEQLRHADRRRQVLGGVLGQVLTEKGEIADGLEYLRLALDRGWNVEVFSRAAEIYLNLADTTTAFELLARVAVDSWTDTAVVNSIATDAQEAVGRDQWKTMVSAARATLAEYYLDGASPPRFVTPDIRVQDGVGTWHAIGDLTAGHTTILAFWSRHDLHAQQDMSRLGEASRRAATHDARVIALVQEPPSSDWDAFVEANHLQFSVYHDVTSAMVRELEVWQYHYFVVDGSGMVRFSYTNLDQALNQAAALHHVEMQRAANPLVSEESDRLP